MNFVAASSQPAGRVGAASIAQDPADPNRLRAAPIAYPNGDGAIRRSTDRGATWSNVAGVPGNDFRTRIAWAGAGMAHASCADGFFRSVDSGANWTLVTNAPFVEAMVVLPTDPNVLYAAGDGAFRIDVVGNSATVTPLNSGLQPLPGYGGATSGYDLALHPSIPAPQGLWLASVAGLYASFDGGASWAPRNTGLRANVVRAIAPNPNPATPSGSRRVLAGVFNTASAHFPLHRSDDNTATWSASVAG